MQEIQEEEKEKEEVSVKGRVRGMRGDLRTDSATPACYTKGVHSLLNSASLIGTVPQQLVSALSTCR